MFLAALLLFQLASLLGCYGLSYDEELGVRLVGNSGSSHINLEGRVEVFREGEWGTVCDDGWNHVSADVVCKTLGFVGYDLSYKPVQDVPLNGVSQIWFTYVDCTGEEDHFFNCTWSKPRNCDHSEDVGVECAYPRPENVDSLPLRVFCPEGASSNCSTCNNTMLYDQYSCSSSVEVAGFVQAYYKGEWKFVDGSTWGEKESHVFCGNIGYPRNFDNPTTEELLGCGPDINDTCLGSELKKQLDNPIMYSLQCEGGETMLKDCFFTSWTSSAYSRGWQPGQYATVQCGFGPGQACNTTKRLLRLKSSPYPGIGRLEQTNTYGWSTICGINFGMNDANVACRQLGYGTAVELGRWAYGSGHSAIADAVFLCSGRETNLDDCAQHRLNITCDHASDIGIICNIPRPCEADELSTRVYREIGSDGRSVNNFLQVYVRGRWGHVCGVGLTAVQGRVICRHVGRQFFLGFRKAHSRTFTGPRYVGSMRCQGNEMSTSKCKMFYFNMRKCYREMEIVVDCTDSLPDLVPSTYSLITSLRTRTSLDSRSVTELSCAVEEDCLSSITKRIVALGYGDYFYRTLLRFDSFIMNLGRRDFLPYLPKSQWEWHECHNHYHSHSHFVTYELIYASDLPENSSSLEKYNFLFSGGRPAVEGHKASFCLQDSQCLVGVSSPFFRCSSRDAFQGISVGCGDMYGSDLDCSWIDVTDAKRDTDYFFRLTVNPQRTSLESDYLNNVAICRITLHRSTVTVRYCETL